MGTDDPPAESFWVTAAKVGFLVEMGAVFSAIAMAIVPSKTGSDRGLGHLFWEDPTFLQEVVVGFLAMNLLLGILGGALVVVLRFEKAKPEA